MLNPVVLTQFEMLVQLDGILRILCVCCSVA